MTIYNTMLLDRSRWDICLDRNGNLAVASSTYAITQDVACAVQTYKGELYYASEDGVPYMDQIIGQLPPVSALCAYFEKAALSVSGVVSAQCTITNFDRASRSLNAQLLFVDENGVTSSVNI